MKPTIAIVDNAVVCAGRKVDNALRAYTAAEANAKERRLELGRALVEARQLFPKTGRNAGGWSRFVSERGINMDVALDAMRYAGWVEEHMPDYEPGKSDPDSLPTRERAGIDKPAEKAPVPADPLPAAAPLLSLVPDQPAGDRDSYCTPEFITACFPVVDFDPCSNSRSTVRSRRACWFAERGEDGLAIAWEGSGYWNVPYSKPLPWAEKFDRERAAITAAGWLVNTDQSTRWWSLLVRSLPLRLDFDDRIQFVAPPGVIASQNDRPQTLLMDEAFWRGCDQLALLKLGTLWRRSGLHLT